MLRDALLSEGVIAPEELHESQLVDRATLLNAHTPEYIDSFCEGSIDPQIIRRIGIPWSEAFVRRSLASVGGTLAASRVALREGIAGNLAGGTHHAFADRGEGYCVFNDIAVASLALLDEGAIRRVAVVDLDVHQGNGTASILGGDSRVFTFSIHGANNFPFTKVPSTLDIALADGIGDDLYLDALRSALRAVFEFEPDCICYQGGVDPLVSDSLGKLAMTHEGLMERDRMVLEEAWRRGIPITLTLGGGYARPIEETVRAHLGTYQVAKEIIRSRRSVSDKRWL